MEYRNNLPEDIKNIIKKNLSIITILLGINSICFSAFSGINARSVIATPTNQTFLSTGKGLDRGNLPEGATQLGYFMIPNGSTLNTITDGSVVTFQNVNGGLVPFYNSIALQGSGYADVTTNIAYYSDMTLNSDNFNHMMIANGNQSWEDSNTGGDRSYDDTLIAFNVQRTDNANVIALDSNGYHAIDETMKFNLSLNSLDTGRSPNYNDSFGHFFRDASGNVLSGGVLDFANVRADIGKATTVIPYSGITPFGSGNTLQYTQGSAVIADINNVNIAAVDVSLLPTNASPALQFNNSASLGSIKNTAGRSDNLLAVTIAPNAIVTLTGTNGTFADGSIVGVNNYSGIGTIDGISADGASSGGGNLILNNQNTNVSLTKKIGGIIPINSLSIIAGTLTTAEDINMTGDLTLDDQADVIHVGNLKLAGTKNTMNINANNIYFTGASNQLGGIITADSSNGTQNFNINADQFIAGTTFQGIFNLNANNNPLTLNSTSDIGNSGSGALHAVNINTNNNQIVIVNPNLYARGVNYSGTGSAIINGTVNMQHNGATNFGGMNIRGTGTAILNQGLSGIGGINGILQFFADGEVQIATNENLNANAHAKGNTSIGTITFLGGNSQWNGSASGSTGTSPIKRLNAKTDTLTLAGGIYNIDEIQGTKSTGTIILPNGTTINGNSNATGGLDFSYDVRGNVVINGITGSHLYPIGNIEITAPNSNITLQNNVSANQIEFVGSESVANLAGVLAGNVLFTSGGTLNINNSNAGVNGKIDGTGKIIISNNATNVNFSNNIGSSTPITYLNLGAEAAVNINGDITFNNPNQAAITLNQNATLNFIGNRNIIGTNGTEYITGITDDNGTIVFTGGYSNLIGLSMGIAGGRLDSVTALNNSVVTTSDNIFVKQLIVGDATNPATLIMKPAKTVSQVVNLFTLANPNSTYQIDSTNATGNLDFYQNTNTGVAYDQVGTIIINANNNPVTVQGTGRFGDSDTQRIKRLVLMGNAAINVDIDTYAVEIIDATNGNVTFNKAHAGTTNPSTLLINSNNEVDINADTTYALVDFKGYNANVKVAEGVTFTSPLADSTNQNSGSIKFVGNGSFVGSEYALPSGIGLMKAGAAGTTVSFSGQQTIKDVQGTSNTGVINFAPNSVLNGSINLAGGAATTINFGGGGFVNGSIGAGAPVGNINLNGPGMMNFLYRVRGNSLNINDSGSIAKIYDDLITPVNFAAPGTLEVAISNLGVNATIDGAGNIIVDPNIQNVVFAKAIGSTNPVNSLKIGQNSKVLINDNVTTIGSGTTLNNGAELIISNNLTLNSPINAINSGNGQINVNPNLNTVLFNKPIGLDFSIDTIDIGNNSQVRANASIVANNVLVNNASLNFGKNGVVVNTLINGSGNVGVQDNIKNVYFQRAIGNVLGIEQFSVGNGASTILRDSLSIDSNSNSGIILGNNAQLYINGTNILIDGKIDGAGSITVGAAPIEANFVHSSSVTFNQEVGSDNPLMYFTLSDDSSARFNKVANFSNIITVGNNSLIQFGDNLNVKLGPNFDTQFFNFVNNSGTIEFVNPNPMQVLALIGLEQNHPKNIVVSNNDVTVNTTQTLTNAIAFSNSQVPATLSLVNATVYDGGITTAGDLIHTIAFGDTSNIGTGAVGGPNNRLKIKLFNNSSNSEFGLIVKSKDFYANVTTESPNKGTLFLSAAEGIALDIGTSDAKLSGVYVNGTGNITAEGNIYSNALYVTNTTLNLNGKSAIINADQIQLKEGGQLLFKGDNASVTGVINKVPGFSNSSSIVIDANNVTFNSLIGNNLAIDSLIMNAGSSATLNENINLDSGGVELNQNSILTLASNSNITTNNGGVIDFVGNNGTLNITKNMTTSIESPIKVNNSGYIKANNLSSGNTLMINQPIGSLSDNKSLSLLQATGGGNIELSGGDAFVNDIDLGNNNGNLILNSAGGNYKFQLSHGASNGNLIVNKDITLKQGTVVSSSSNSLNKVVLANGNNLTVEGVDLYATGGINTISSGQGMIIFNGSSTVGAVVGQNNSLNSMLVGGSGSIVTFLNKINLINNLTVNPGNVARIKADTIAANIESTIPNQGTIEFINNSSITVTGNLGANEKLNKVTMTNRSVSITGGFAAQAVNFTKPNQVSALKILGNSNLADMNVITNSTARNHNIHVSTDQHITGNWGSANNLMGGIHLRGDNNLIIDTPNFFSSVNISTNNTGTVELREGSFAYELGRFDGNSLKQVNFTGNAASYGVIKSQLIEVADGKTATFGSGIKIEDSSRGIIRPHLMSANGMILGAGSVANFADNALLDGAIMPKNAGLAIVNFNGRSEIRGLMGNAQTKLAEVNFKGINNKDPVRLVKDISADKINFDNVATEIAYTIKLDGPVNAKNTDFDLNSKILTLPTGSSVFSGNMNIATSFDGMEGGHITVTGAGSSLDFSNVDLMNITVTADTQLASDQQKSYTLFLKAHGGEVIQNNNINVTSNDTNRYVKWIYDPVHRQLIVGSNPTVLHNDINNNPNINGDDRDKAIFLVNHDTNPVGRNIVQGLGTMNKKAVANALKRMEPTSNSASIAVAENSRSTNNVITNRTTKINTASNINFTDEANGVAAGDEELTYGAWFSPFYEQARQSLRSLKAGFKSNSFGGTLGYDTKVNDFVTAGAGISYIDTGVNYRDSKSGDKTKINSAILSIYGIREFLNNWFMQANGSVGYSFVKNSERRDIARNISQQAKSKYHLNSYSMQLLAGYDYRITRSFMATPMFGVLGERLSKISYREHGAGIQNLIVNRKPSNSLEAIAGGKLTLAKEIQKILLTSELHSFVNYNFIHKAAGMRVNIVDIADPLPISTVKPAKFSYNIGGSIEASHGIMSYGVVYDAIIEHRYISHQATIKAKVDL